MRPHRPAFLTAALAALVLAGAGGGAPTRAGGLSLPWLDRSLSADRRADLLVGEMTLDEKLQLVTGYFGASVPTWSSMPPPPPGARGTDGFVPGIARLRFPDLHQVGARLGVSDFARRAHGEAIALPSGLAQAATWNPALAYAGARMVGLETRDQGFNVHLGAGANLARELRGGRTFEWSGEDPLLAGRMVAARLRGIQSAHIVTTSHIYAVNDQETDRRVINSVIDDEAMRESDLLAFELAITGARPGAVMCAYNSVNGVPSCANELLLNQVLKHEWGFAGWVMADWGAVYSTVPSALAGLDQETGTLERDGRRVILPSWGDDQDAYYGRALGAAIGRGEVPVERLNEMVHRIARSMIASGAIDDPPRAVRRDLGPDLRVARSVAEQAIVLLRNEGAMLPLAGTVRRVALIGSHADVGVLTGGGSSEVIPPGGSAVPQANAGNPMTWEEQMAAADAVATWLPSSPLRAIQSRLRGGRVRYADGQDVAAAAALAAQSDVAIVVVNQWSTEGNDLPGLVLPHDQDELVRRVAAANANTVVVIESGTAVLMPWLPAVRAVIEAWYPGAGGGEAIAGVLFGDVNPSGRLPITFPASEADLPRPARSAAAAAEGSAAGQPRRIDVDYFEGARVGYKWFESEHHIPLFPFGHGLSYTRFEYSGLSAVAASSSAPAVTFELRNAGSRVGRETAQVYVTLPPGSTDAPRRLAAWDKLRLSPGESRQVRLELDPRLLAVYDVGRHRWRIPAGRYRIEVAASATDVRLQTQVEIEGNWLRPDYAHPDLGRPHAQEPRFDFQKD